MLPCTVSLFDTMGKPTGAPICLMMPNQTTKPQRVSQACLGHEYIKYIRNIIWAGYPPRLPATSPNLLSHHDMMMKPMHGQNLPPFSGTWQFVPHTISAAMKIRLKGGIEAMRLYLVHVGAMDVA